MEMELAAATLWNGVHFLKYVPSEASDYFTTNSFDFFNLNIRQKQICLQLQL